MLQHITLVYCEIIVFCGHGISWFCSKQQFHKGFELLDFMFLTWNILELLLFIGIKCRWLTLPRKLILQKYLWFHSLSLWGQEVWQSSFILWQIYSTFPLETAVSLCELMSTFYLYWLYTGFCFGFVWVFQHHLLQNLPKHTVKFILCLWVQFFKYKFCPICHTIFNFLFSLMSRILIEQHPLLGISNILSHVLHILLGCECLHLHL